MQLETIRLGTKTTTKASSPKPKIIMAFLIMSIWPDLICNNTLLLQGLSEYRISLKRYLHWIAAVYLVEIWPQVVLNRLFFYLRTVLKKEDKISFGQVPASFRKQQTNRERDTVRVAVYYVLLGTRISFFLARRQNKADMQEQHFSRLIKWHSWVDRALLRPYLPTWKLYSFNDFSSLTHTIRLTCGYIHLHWHSTCRI